MGYEAIHKVEFGIFLEDPNLQTLALVIMSASEAALVSNYGSLEVEENSRNHPGDPV